MYPYLVDVPVKINIWIREECQKMQFDILRKARPSILFIQSDGGRNEKEWKAIRANRKLFDEKIDWECEVYRIYEDTNQGLYAMGRKVAKYIWDRVDRCIFLEDDQLMSVSFFRFCAELLEKYKDDTRINCICGMNHLGVYKATNTDYFFSRQGSIWGIATWKRSWELRQKGFDYGNDPYSMKLLKERLKNNKSHWKREQAYIANKHFEGHAPGSEFWIEHAMYAENQLQIIPKYNMICNIGYVNAEHFSHLKALPPKTRTIFNMKTYEYHFPLKHPRIVAPDLIYEKQRNKIMAYNTPLIKVIRFIQGCILKTIYEDKLYIIHYIQRKINGKERES